MKDLIDYIDQSIKDCINEVNSFGLCHLLHGDNEQYPATVENQAIKATPNDKFKINIYHRLVNGVIDPREDLSFGRSVTGQNNQKLRTVIFIKLDQEDLSLIDNIINALPDVFEPAPDGYRQVFASKNITLIRDRDAIWTEEFSDAYKDRYQLKFLIYALEYDLSYIKCSVCV